VIAYWQFCRCGHSIVLHNGWLSCDPPSDCIVEECDCRAFTVETRGQRWRRWIRGWFGRVAAHDQPPAQALGTSRSDRAADLVRASSSA